MPERQTRTLDTTHDTDTMADTAHALEAGNVHTAAQAESLSDAALLEIDGISQAEITEIRDALA